MPSLNKSFLSILSLFIMLFWHPIAHAESNDPHQLQTQIQQLQTQLKDANRKITVLETAMNTTNEDINGMRNCESCKGNSSSQLNTTNTIVRRTANGHGR